MLYLPPGTYRITATLVAGPALVPGGSVGGKPQPKCPGHAATSPTGCGWLGGSVIGHGRLTTVVWAGPLNGHMFWSHGLGYWSFVGVHWAGRAEPRGL